MKFILLYRGRLGNKNFHLFNTREEAHDYSRSEGMIDKEIFGIFELDNPAVVPSFFWKTINAMNIIVLYIGVTGRRLFREFDRREDAEVFSKNLSQCMLLGIFETTTPIIV